MIPQARASLLVQRLRIRPPMQGTRVGTLVQEDPTCYGATKPVHHNYWAIKKNENLPFATTWMNLGVFFKNKFIYFLFFWLYWVSVAACGLSLVVVSGGYSSLRCPGFSLWWLLLLQSVGARRAGSVVVVHGLSCSIACGIFLDQGYNPCPLHWWADS